MAKTTYIDIPDEQKEDFWSSLQAGDRYTFPRVRVKNALLSRNKKIVLTAKSIMPIASGYWKAMTAGEQATWKTIDFHTRKHGWRTFLADTSKRIKAGIPGIATPSTYHQASVGLISISAPATGATFEQPHPALYYLWKKIPGHKSEYAPLQITEQPGLPIKLAISYKSDLTAIEGETATAKVKLKIYYPYQGLTLTTNLEINLELSHEWTREEITLSTLIGSILYYEAQIEILNARGDFYFDNVEITHTAQNWARDIYCQNVAQSFSKVYYQIPKHWVITTDPTGVEFGSIYPPD